MPSFNIQNLRTMVTFFVFLSTFQTWAADVSMNAGVEELTAFEQSAYISSMPKGSTKFSLTPQLLNTFASSCINQNSKLFDSKNRTNSLVESTVRQRIKKKLSFVDINSRNGESYLLGNPNDAQYLLCTMMIWTGVSEISEAFEAKNLSQDFLYKALTFPETDISFIEHFYSYFATSPNLTGSKIEGFFQHIFSREQQSLKLLIHIADQISRNQTSNNFNLTKTFLRKLPTSATYKKFPVYFTKKALNSLNSSSLTKSQRTEIVLGSLQSLETSIVLNEIFNSIFSWDLSEGRLLDLYNQNRTKMTSQQQYNLLAALMTSLKSTSEITNDEIWQALNSEEFSQSRKSDLRYLIISDSENHNKYGSNFVWKVILLELRNQTRNEKMTSYLLSQVRGKNLTSNQKSTILNNVAQDSNLTVIKIQDLLTNLQHALLTKSLNAEEVNFAMKKIILLAPKDQRTRDFLFRFINHLPYNSSSEDVVMEILKGYSINESEGISIIMWSLENESINAPSNITTVVERVGISEQIGRAIATISSKLARQKRFQSILEYVMNHPDTEVSTKGTIRYKLTGELPTIDPSDINW